MNFKKLTILAISSVLLFTSCNNDDDNDSAVRRGRRLIRENVVDSPAKNTRGRSGKRN